MINSVDIYNQKLNTYFNLIQTNDYLFEVEKCCGYSEFFSSYKKSTLHDLYKNISYRFEIDLSKLKLYMHNSETRETIIVPNTIDMTIKQFQSNNLSFFKPIYPMPACVVYKIRYDDGHCHVDHNTSVVCGECVIHT